MQTRRNCDFFFLTKLELCIGNLLVEETVFVILINIWCFFMGFFLHLHH